MQSAPKCTANNAGWNDKAVQEIVRIPRTVKHRGVDNGFPESGEAPVTGKCCVRHNRNGEKNGDANQAEKGVSAVTEG